MSQIHDLFSPFHHISYTDNLHRPANIHIYHTIFQSWALDQDRRFSCWIYHPKFSTKLLGLTINDHFEVLICPDGRTIVRYPIEKAQIIQRSCSKLLVVLKNVEQTMTPKVVLFAKIEQCAGAFEDRPALNDLLENIP